MAEIAAVGGSAAWRGPALIDDPAWIVELQGDEIDALGDATRRRPPLPEIAATTAAVRRELVDGRGFVVLRGLPVEDMTVEECERAYRVLGQHVGIAVPQNPAGDLLVHVRDEGLDYTDPHVRGYQTRARLRLPRRRLRCRRLAVRVRCPTRRGQHDRVLDRHPR